MSSNNNIYLQALAGKYEGDLPEPTSPNGILLKEIAEAGESGGKTPMVVTYTSAKQTVNYGKNLNLTLDIEAPKEGMTPLGIVAVRYENGDGGQNATYVITSSFFVGDDGNSVTVKARNGASSSSYNAMFYVSVSVLWI